MVKTVELRQKGKDELLEELTKLRTELAALRVAEVTGSVASKLGKIKTVRKDIARVLTVINQKARSTLRKEYRGSKYIPLDLRSKKTRAIRRRLSTKDYNRKLEKQVKREAAFPKRKFAVRA